MKKIPLLEELDMTKVIVSQTLPDNEIESNESKVAEATILSKTVTTTP